jgi:hypothetical protein
MAPERFVVDVAVFAHQEESTVPNAIGDLARQSVLRDPAIDLRIWILPNGCRDRTAEAARNAVERLPPDDAARFTVLDLPKPGKSRTINAFMHEISRPEADIFICMDADVRLVEQTTLSDMVSALATRPQLRIFTGRPVKDIVHHKVRTGPVERLIAAGSEQLTDYRTSLAGGLYAIRAEAARRVHLPIGLPVEDGFLRAMVVTDFLSGPEHLERIDGDPRVFFIYESIRTIPALIRHQTRIVVGSAINAMLFARIRRLTRTSAEAEDLLREAARDETWLSAALKEDLPRAPFGYVPFHFLTKRIERFKPEILLSPMRVLAFLGGLGLDVVAWVRASFIMSKGRGAGHW